jgi:hypothetical protein
MFPSYDNFVVELILARYRVRHYDHYSFMPEGNIDSTQVFFKEFLNVAVLAPADSERTLCTHGSG